MTKFFQPLFRQNALPTLIAYNITACLLLFAALQFWRHCYFLTDDNLSGGYPVMIEIGRHLQRGEWPCVSVYLFGGAYDWSRDAGGVFWHPFFLLPSLLADTWAKLWIVDLSALSFLLTTTLGFSLLAARLRDEYELKLSDGRVIFYTMSFVFSFYTLAIGPSWIGFLSSQSALPWFTLGILDRSVLRGVFIVFVTSVHQFLGSYPGMNISTSLLFTLFAMGCVVCQKSPRPFFIWFTGSTIALLLLSPLLLHILDGLAHANRIRGLTVQSASEFNIPAWEIPFAFFLGSWTEPLDRFQGTAGAAILETIAFVTSFFACAAAWCLIPALGSSRRWRPLEVLCILMAVVIIVMIIRPAWMANIMQFLPLIKSLRWPFREILQCLFFLHLLMILRPQVEAPRWKWTLPCFSLCIFILALPFCRVPTLNPLPADRAAVLTGDGEAYWNRVRQYLGPNDQVEAIIDLKLWQVYHAEIPYCYIGTANFPALYQIHSIAGYSPTSPRDQLALKTTPSFWFGAADTTQIPKMLHEYPRLRFIILEGMHPMKITLRTQGQPDIDLTPFLPPSTANL